MNKRTFIEENGIRFTPLDPDKDAEVLVALTISPSFVHHHFDGIYKPYLIAEVKEKMKELLRKSNENNSKQYFAVREAESGQMIGVLQIGEILSTHQTAWLTIDMVDDDVFKDHAPDVLRMAMRYGFLELGLYRVCVNIPSYNNEEISLYEAAGFLRETQRRQAVYYNGAFYDELLYGMLRIEWIKLQQEVAV